MMNIGTTTMRAIGTVTNTEPKKFSCQFFPSPMLYVKPPKTVLVLFHLFRATKLPLFRGIDRKRQRQLHVLTMRLLC
jgi:hypothetical protein